MFFILCKNILWIMPILGRRIYIEIDKKKYFFIFSFLFLQNGILTTLSQLLYILTSVWLWPLRWLVKMFIFHTSLQDVDALLQKMRQKLAFFELIPKRLST